GLVLRVEAGKGREEGGVNIEDAERVGADEGGTEQAHVSGEADQADVMGAQLIEEQAELVGIPLLKIRATYATYERELRNLLFDLRSDGLTRGIFGDIYLREHRDWFQNVVSDFDIRALFPLWGIPTQLLIEEQRRAMRSVIIQIERKISESYLGKEVNREFIEYMLEMGYDPCGESGEYHTFVCASPLMQGEIILTHAERHATPQFIGLEIDYWKKIEKK
ncbi:MAG: hypothetical protein DYG96_15620, partial [Chlorobi bacterium CHB2]|nr:hypothetical protein [Chlorobi bacterium CHB2]